SEVPYEEVAKGFELPGGEMVVLTDEDLADLPLTSSKSIEVLHFTPAGQLDPILFNRATSSSRRRPRYPGPPPGP
ncbi:MAG TPA: Ku protein, partial [Streptosporangiaceae bacterium]|nr:Ku protein [Streptosporangiaceae bacterium]